MFLYAGHNDAIQRCIRREISSAHSFVECAFSEAICRLAEHHHLPKGRIIEGMVLYSALSNNRKTSHEEKID